MGSDEALPLARLALHHLPLNTDAPQSHHHTKYIRYLSIAPVSLELYLACFHLVA